MIKVNKTEQQWRLQLTEQQFKVTREAATEAPFSGEFVHFSEKGVYHCICCHHALFSSEDKFDSGCGWPSFSQELAQANIKQVLDTSHGMHRIEVRCPQCDAHLGHVFDDGPKPTKLRYCINSVALSFGE